MKLLFCGDIMPGGVLPYQNEFLSSTMKDYLEKFDLIIGTLETAIGTNIPYDAIKMEGRQNIIYSRDEDFFRLKEMNIGVVTLANNHIFDLGVEGLKNTIDTLKKNNIQYCGAGLNIEEASKPIILDIDNHKIGILAYCSSDPNQVAYVPIATENTYGVNPLDINRASEDVKKYKEICDKIVILVHWGKEYSSFPIEQIKHESYRLIESGADFIIGTHTHCVQPHITHKHGHIYLSLGNFIFPDFFMSPPRPIFYPKVENIKNIKTTYFYPFPITEPLKRVWPNKSRIGMGVEMELGEKIKLKDQLLLLDTNNILQLYHSKIITLKLWIIGKIIKMPLYRGGKFITAILSRIVKVKNYIYRISTK